MPHKNQKLMHAVTWGCQMNQHESEIIRALLNRESDYQWTDKIEDADLIVLNTCSVREHAEKRVLGFLGNLKHLKEKRPDLVIAFGGCMAQNPITRAYIRKKAPHVNVIFGTRNFHQLPDLIKESVNTNTCVIKTDPDDEELPGILPAHYESKVKAYVTIMYGCNNFCTYCIVPYTRGREKSRPPQEIYREVSQLAEQGYLEVMLLGQNVNSYGRDLPGGEVSFVELLQKLDRVPGLARIRYLTSHPRDFSEQLIAAIAASEKVCEHFHLPLQAGSNKILERMNRGYTRDGYLELVKKIRDAIPGASITTDLIVGFPGETETDFLETLDIVKKVRFDSAYTFLYSQRTGTPAAEMGEQVPIEDKKRRLAELMKIQNEISLAQNKPYEGLVFDVLVEGRSRTNPMMWSGRTRTNKIVIFPGEDDLDGKLVNVKISCAHTWTLYGSMN